MFSSNISGLCSDSIPTNLINCSIEQSIWLFNQYSHCDDFVSIWINIWKRRKKTKSYVWISEYNCICRSVVFIHRQSTLFTVCIYCETAKEKIMIVSTSAVQWAKKKYFFLWFLRNNKANLFYHTVKSTFQTSAMRMSRNRHDEKLFYHQLHSWLMFHRPFSFLSIVEIAYELDEFLLFWFLFKKVNEKDRRHFFVLTQWSVWKKQIFLFLRREHHPRWNVETVSQRTMSVSPMTWSPPSFKTHLAQLPVVLRNIQRHSHFWSLKHGISSMNERIVCQFALENNISYRCLSVLLGLVVGQLWVLRIE